MQSPKCPGKRFRKRPSQDIAVNKVLTGGGGSKKKVYSPPDVIVNSGGAKFLTRWLCFWFIVDAGERLVSFGAVHVEFLGLQFLGLQNSGAYRSHVIIKRHSKCVLLLSNTKNG